MHVYCSVNCTKLNNVGNVSLVQSQIVQSSLSKTSMKLWDWWTISKQNLGKIERINSKFDVWYLSQDTYTTRRNSEFSHILIIETLFKQSDLDYWNSTLTKYMSVRKNNISYIDIYIDTKPFGELNKLETKVIFYILKIHIYTNLYFNIIYTSCLAKLLYIYNNNNIYKSILLFHLGSNNNNPRINSYPRIIITWRPKISNRRKSVSQQPAP